MEKKSGGGLRREDFTKALGEMETFVDVTADDLMELNARAQKHAQIRVTEGMRVAELMSQPVQTVYSDTPLAHAAHEMVTHRISGLAVINDQRQLVGVITEGDFLRALGVPVHQPAHGMWHTLEAMFTHHSALDGLNGTVSELMVTEVITVAPQQTLHHVLEVMKENRVRRVVVCDDNRRVVGMVTRSDLVRAFFDRLVRTASA